MFDGNKSLVAIRFGGYPETVLAMSDALFSGSKIALRLPKEKSETELTTHGGNYSRRMKAGDTASECVLKANGDEKKEKDESPRDLYIFCKDESGLFTELDSKLSVPLMPEWEEYFIRELKDRKILKRLNVFSTNAEFAAYAVTLKKGETQIAKVLTDGLESGEICIPNAKRDDTAFRDIETFTQYLNAFGKDIAKKIQATFKPVFNPAEESICPELNEVNEYIKKNVGYSLYEAQLAGAEAIKRQLKKEKMTMLVSGCGTGKTKIGSAALYAYQKSIGGGRRINVITCPSHVAKKWVRELYETVPNCIARVVSSITDVDRMYELYKTSDKPVFMVLSKESARSGYLRKPTVMWNKRRKGFIPILSSEASTSIRSMLFIGISVWLLSIGRMDLPLPTLPFRLYCPRHPTRLWALRNEDDRRWTVAAVTRARQKEATAVKDCGLPTSRASRWIKQAKLYGLRVPTMPWQSIR